MSIELPQDTVERAEYEILNFERLSVQTGKELVSELKQFRAENVKLKREAELGRLAYNAPIGAAMDLIYTVMEYVSMPCDSLKERMEAALKKFMYRENKDKPPTNMGFRFRRLYDAWMETNWEETEEGREGSHGMDSSRP